MKKTIIATTIIVAIATQNAFALSSMPANVKNKAVMDFARMYTAMKDDTDTVKVQKLNTALNSLLKKQAIYKTLDTNNETMKKLILSQIEELNSANPTTYPGCNTPDVAAGRQIWSSCNVGSNMAGTGVNNAWDYFAFGTGATIEGIDWKSYSNWWKSKWKERDQAVCGAGYHLPTKDEFKELYGYYGCQLNTGVGNKNKACGKTVVEKLNIPTTGYFWGVKGFQDSPYALFWTSSENAKATAWTLRINLKPSDKDYGYSALATDSKTYGYAVRCVKN